MKTIGTVLLALVVVLSLGVIVAPAPTMAADNGENLVNAMKGIVLGEVWNGFRAAGNQVERQTKKLGPVGIVTGLVSGAVIGVANVVVTPLSGVATILSAGNMKPVENGWDSGPPIDPKF